MNEHHCCSQARMLLCISTNNSVELYDWRLLQDLRAGGRRIILSGTVKSYLWSRNKTTDVIQYYTLVLGNDCLGNTD